MIVRKSAIKKLITLLALVILFVTLTLLSENKAVCEFFATTFARAWIFVSGHVLGVLPFSCYELFLIVAIVLAVVFVVCLVLFLARRKWNKLVSMLLITAITVFTFLDIYTATATMTYNRYELPDEVYTEYNSDNLTFEEAVELAEIMIKGANNAYAATEHDEDGNIVYPYTFGEMSELMAEEYKRLDNKYFSSYTPRAKKIINKTIMSELHIVGVFFAPFGEANINGYEDNLFLPQTLAHELAHSKGVMREFQANIVSYYVLLQSNNPYLRYGAYVKCLSSALQIVRMYPDSQSEYARLQSLIDSRIYTERNNYGKFYSQFHLFDDLGDFINDLYLKLQKQPDGTDSYVKPPVTEGTGQVDSSGSEIVFVVSFSGEQNLLITLYKQGKLKLLS